MAMSHNTSAIVAITDEDGGAKLGAHLASSTKKAEVLPVLTATDKDGNFRPRAYGHSASGVAELKGNVRDWLDHLGVAVLALECATTSNTRQEHCEKRAYSLAMANEKVAQAKGPKVVLLFKSRPPCGYRADPVTKKQCEACWDWLKKLTIAEHCPVAK